MKVYDNLPRCLRDLLKDSMLNWNPCVVAKDLQFHGLANTIQILEDKNKLATKILDKKKAG